MKSTSLRTGLLGRRQLIMGAIAVGIAAIAAPFGTGALSVPARLAFWALLIGFNLVKWSLWYRHGLGRAGLGWQGVALMVVAGAILLNLTLPFEVMLGFRLVGIEAAVDWAPNFVAAMVISLGVGTGIAMAQGARPIVAEASAPAPPPAEAPTGLALRAEAPTGLALRAEAPIGLALRAERLAGLALRAEAPSGLALRAGLADLGQIESLVAEDHYLRLHLADGRSPLVLYRFGDAVRELAGIDGEQVHRGAWVAAAAVRGAVREGRRWRLCLAGGTRVSVSETFLPVVRARGWLARRHAPVRA